MAKRSNRSPPRYEKDQSSCMRGLISMLDFRHSRSTQRFLSIRRRGSENAVCVGNAEHKFMLISSAGNCPRPLDGEEGTSAIDACKPSVKKLLEEEMTGEKVDQKEASKNEVEAKQFDSGQGDDGRKKWNIKNKTCKKSSTNNLDMDVADNIVSEGSCRYKPQQQTTSNHDIDNLMEEFFRKGHQKSINCVNHTQLEQSSKSYGLEERLSEAIKFLVSHKLLNGNQLTEDGEVQASKEVMDAIQISSLDEELFSELLQNPNSLLLKCVQGLPDAHLKDEESKPLAESNCSDVECVDLRQRNEPVNRKHRNFFRRKPKSQERDLSDGNKASQASNKIAILKPGTTCLQTPETGSSTSSSSESQYIIRHRKPNEKVGSHFFIAEIKRKLKHAMGRDQHRITRDGISERFTNEQQNSDDSGVKEYIGMNSPTKDHFFIERIDAPSIVDAKGEKTSMLKGSELGTEYDTDLSRRRVSIYIEGKNHLSELLAKGNENVDLSSTQVRKTSDGILSLPEYNSSPVGCPGLYLEPSITAQMRFAGSDKSQVGEHNHVNLVSNLSQMPSKAEKTDIQLCSSENKTCNEVEGDNAISDKLDTCLNNEKEDSFFCSMKDEMSSEDSWSVVEATEIMVHEEIKLLDASSGTSDSSVTTDDKIVEIYEVRDEEQNPWCLKQDSSEMDEQTFSPLASPSNPSVKKKIECIESVADIQEWSSPISVLQPIFTDDLFSPSSVKSYSGETSLQPLRIRLEEQNSWATNQSNHLKACMDDNETIFEHIKAVLQASNFNWDELYIRSLSSDVLINPLLLDEVDYLPNQLCQDQNLLFDCINEVLVEFCGHYFGSPGISFVKPNIRPLPNMNNTIQEVSKGVYWHLLPMPLPLTLDLIVGKDFAKSGTWMDLQLDTGCIGVDIGEAIFEDLVEDTITSYINESRECEYNMLPA